MSVGGRYESDVCASFRRSRDRCTDYIDAVKADIGDVDFVTAVATKAKRKEYQRSKHNNSAVGAPSRVSTITSSIMALLIVCLSRKIVFLLLEESNITNHHIYIYIYCTCMPVLLVRISFHFFGVYVHI